MENADSYEPQRQYRWVLENPGLESFRVASISVSRDKMFGLRMKVYLLALASTDLSRFPFDGTEAILKILDKKGEVISRYRVTWSGSSFLPFEKLDYDSLENIFQVVDLMYVSFLKDP